MADSYLELKGRLEGLVTRREAYVTENAARTAGNEPHAYSAQMFLELAERMEAVANAERTRVTGLGQATALKVQAREEAASLKARVKEQRAQAKEQARIDSSPIAALISTRRGALKMTQSRLAASVGCTITAVRMWESDRCQPAKNWLKAITSVLGGTPEEYHSVGLAQAALARNASDNQSLDDF